MSIKSTAAIVVLVFVAALGISVIGQEEPLPKVTPKGAVSSPIPLGEPTIVLATEPIRDYQPPTLLEAALNNDYLTFDALYTAAKRRGEDVSQYDALHELWTYGVTDPIGAFYGRELYERLSRAFPGYTRFVEPHTIVDNRGNVFYPTSETRQFLIDRVIEGKTAPRLQIAESQEDQTRPLPRVVSAAPQTVAAAPPRATRKPSAPPIESAPIESVVSEPAVITSAPATSEPVATTAEPAPAMPEPVAIAPEPVAIAPAPARVAQQPPATQPARSPLSRGILLTIIGLIGIGLLAVILRAPREEPMRVVKEPPHSNVEPIRKADAEPPRRTGSHG